MKGFMYTLEVILGTIILISFLLVMSAQINTLSTPVENLDETAYDLLNSLDDRGLLRGYAVSHDFDSLNNSISFYRYNHLVEICDYEENCYGHIPNASNIWVGTYVISGEYTYSPHIVRLYLW